MQLKRGVIEIGVILTLVAAGSQWIRPRSQQATCDVTATPATTHARSGTENYLVNNVHLGMTENQLKVSLLKGPDDRPPQTRLDSSGQLCWIKGDNFAHLVPLDTRSTNGKESRRPPSSDILLQRGTARSLVLEKLGSPIGHDDNDSKWGYWTKGLPNRDMGLLIEFRGDRVESIEMASQWGELAGHLASPILSKPSPVVDHPKPQPEIGSQRTNSPYNPPPQLPGAKAPLYED